MPRVVDEVRAFVKESLLGKDDYFDSLPEPPTPAQRAFQDRGLANWWLPRAYGGRGLGLEESVDVVAELAYGDAGTAFSLFISIIGTSTLQLFGSEAQRKRFLTPMAETGGFSAALGTERVELLDIETTAVRAGEGYVLKGHKLFSTNAAQASFRLVLARCPGEDVELRAFVVPDRTPGLRIEKRWRMSGVRGSATYEVMLDGCVVPLELCLEGNGLRILEVGLNPSRVLIAATAIGICRRLRDLCLQFGAQKKLKGDTLLGNAVYAGRLAQIDAEIDAMHSVCKTAAREYDAMMARPDAADQLMRCGVLNSVMVAKLICGQLGWAAASRASEMFGGMGYTHDLPVAKLLRDIRYVAIIEGGDDALRDLLFNRYVLPSSTATGA